MTTSSELELTAPNGINWSQPTGLFIDNEFVMARSGQSITTIDPATEKTIAAVQAAGEEDVDLAVRAADRALKHDSWRLMSGSDRGILMSRLANSIEQYKELFATIDAWDNGKSYQEALNNDLPEAIATIRYYSGWADKTFGQTISTTSTKFAYTLRQPTGVVAQIIPWNYPLSMATWKLGPALACGNTVVLKAAEQTPLSILVLAGLIREAGFPAGVVNIINGLGGVAGAHLVQHELVSKVAFTGSTATASQIMKLAAPSLKNISLETGGKSPLIVFPDADITQAVKWSHFGIMSNQGQICTATSRIIVHESIIDSFLQAFVELVEATKIGDQWDKSTYQGPQVSKQQHERVLQHIEAAKQAGARLVTGGTALDRPGFFIDPTVFADVETSMGLWREEVFGPVAAFTTFSSEEEAIAKANDSQYGLGASVFTENLKCAHRVAAAIDAGMVWINSSQDCDPRIPFGGVKRSGIGRELGEAGLEAYSQIKAVHVNMGNEL